MTDKKPDPQRRQTLKKILAGSSVVGASTVVPDAWVKPVVDAVVLPAHAQASPAFMLPLNAAWAGGGGVNGLGSVAPRSEEGLAQRFLDQIVPEAQAGDVGGACLVSVSICLSTVSANQVSVQLAVFPGPQGTDTATVVNGVIQQPFSIAGFTVTGALSGDGETWTGQIMGPCPANNAFNNVDPDGIFTGERIDVAALDLALVVNGNANVDVDYIAELNAPCRIGDLR